MVIEEGGEVHLEVSNLGRASTSNATLAYVTEERTWFPVGDHPGESPCEIESFGFNYSSPRCGFGVNATNSTESILNFGDAPISNGQGTFYLFYQKRVIDASGWISEPVNDSIIEYSPNRKAVLPSPSVFLSIACIFLAALGKREVRVEML